MEARQWHSARTPHGFGLKRALYHRRANPSSGLVRMKAKPLQIFWHQRDPILSLDFHCKGLLATGGADKDIKVWEVGIDDEGMPTAKYKFNLSHHNYAVNTVRFSPAGDMLASGGDGGELLLWKLHKNAEGELVWKVKTPLMSHTKDILDLAWSPEGTGLISGSVDNTSVVWNIAKGNVHAVLSDHAHYVQGVAWDPANGHIATLSGDRTCRIHAAPLLSSQQKGRKQAAPSSLCGCQHILLKRDVPADAHQAARATDGKPEQSHPPPFRHHLFHDENLPSFFRRLAWSPDGAFLIIPAGHIKTPTDSAGLNTCYVFSRKNLTRPVLHVPSGSKPAVAVRFCPKLFARLRPPHEIEEAEQLQVFELPYRLIYAIATLNSVFVYDTQHSKPIAILAGLHYAAITDLAWSGDARYLAASSQDGYCSLAVFEEGELGEPLAPADLPAHVAERLPEVVRAKAEEAARAQAEEAAAQHAATLAARSSSKTGGASASNVTKAAPGGTAHGQRPGMKPVKSAQVDAEAYRRPGAPSGSASSSLQEDGGEGSAPRAAKRLRAEAVAGSCVPGGGARHLTPVPIYEQAHGPLPSSRANASEAGKEGAERLLPPSSCGISAEPGTETSKGDAPRGEVASFRAAGKERDLRAKAVSEVINLRVQRETAPPPDRAAPGAGGGSGDGVAADNKDEDSVPAPWLFVPDSEGGSSDEVVRFRASGEHVRTVPDSEGSDDPSQSKHLSGVLPGAGLIRQSGQLCEQRVTVPTPLVGR